MCGVNGSRNGEDGGGLGGREQVSGGKDASAPRFISRGRQGEPLASTLSREQTFALRRSTQGGSTFFP